jgi:uncharacterized small protein (TIGR04563 family)
MIDLRKETVVSRKKGGVKVSIYFPDDMIKDLINERRRTDRSVSWLVIRAWKLAKKEIKALPPEATP